MGDIHKRLAALGLKIPEILLPKPGAELEKWAVIACDQFTQDLHYWEKARAIARDAPSCLNLIFPEAYLGDGRPDSRIQSIHRAMASYMNEGIFAPPRLNCVYIERATPFHPCRRGLVLAVDLDQYDWAPDSRPLIRSTEGTIKERLPPRMDIRRGAPLETPHILLLIDDEEDTLLPSLGELAKNAGSPAPLYDTPLMMDSGSVKGWPLDNEKAWTKLAEGLEKLGGKANLRYGVQDSAPFLYAVGDGNHSLATAKGIWEEYKALHKHEQGYENHPCRWALVELENLYDPGISFEPIHRVLFDTEASAIEAALKKLPGFRYSKKGERYFALEADTAELATVTLQPLLDELAKPTGAAIDYIHGKEELRRLAADASRPAICIELPPIRKNGLFQTVAKNGPLPRKSFSMGEAREKRFYLECRKLFG
ncbi:DUF1015 domain-containing protein [Leadbettera azotonutricia]|uniref:DUF1015 domain-containing protein n=1 Tax=Leadbettera azotonutricia (strain ATCC BAA-888 / DSM 13862 / ZAS-9) TaxID=545695 RepID=F5YCR7_LEAAZ|nr:DUF1015 domain-containing protein [Leadbettera azotonutricia]AEF82002.1 conserved hypothetical protein [Leadbettera azotonutricia ZAS-9]